MPNPEDYTRPDIIDMPAKERDRIVAEWMGEVGSYVFPLYSKRWQHCGRVLEALPNTFAIQSTGYIGDLFHYRGLSPENGVETVVGTGGFGSKKDLKTQITKAAALCWLNGIEPETGDSDD